MMPLNNIPATPNFKPKIRIDPINNPRTAVTAITNKGTACGDTLRIYSKSICTGMRVMKAQCMQTIYQFPFNENDDPRYTISPP
jgi:hypothetical protein